MKGYVFDPVAKTMSFYRGAGQTTLVLPDSFPLLLIPGELSLSNYDVVFPDVPKGRMYTHNWSVSKVRDQQNVYHYNSIGVGRALVTALPQEWSQVTALADAPSGTDLFKMQARIVRTVAPTHSWSSLPIVVTTKQNDWLSLTGSIYLEASLGFSRSMSIYIDDDALLPDGITPNPMYRKLVLHQQQSVMPAPGGYGLIGSGEPAVLTNPPGLPLTASGGEMIANGAAGFPVFYGGDVAPQYQWTQLTDSAATDPFGNIKVSQHNRASGSAPPSTSDPTNFGATWRLDLRGQFGRRS